MTVNVETIEFDGNIVKKFTTDLAPGNGQDIITWTCPNTVANIMCFLVAGDGGGGAMNCTPFKVMQSLQIC